MSAWQSGDVRGAGVRIHYHRTGGAKPAVVMLHGVTDNGLCWSRLAAALAPDFDCVMLDARGHGQSEALETGYTAEDHACDVAAVVDALGLGRPVVVGHSMGGATAAATAANFPDRVRALILEDPPFRGEPLQDSALMAERIAGWQAGLAKRRTQSLAAIVAYGRRQNPTWSDTDLAEWAEAKRQTDPRIANGISGHGIRWQDVACCVTCPTLLVTADPAYGGIMTPNEADEAQRLCPAARTTVIAGAGHNIRRDQFETFLRVVRDFLNTL
ncbi:MAG: alpha/beta hydrolase [Chloroflexi bacterium]|nr:alpha/beta hydrolase [Chloroflexota bacterium]